ncbi:MAG: hypothetical protein LBK63_05870 [Treponema sp.]|nr:hypothetical protein [Treponema sp.]
MNLNPGVCEKHCPESRQFDEANQPVLKIRVVQKLQFLNNNRLKRQNAEHFARLVQQPTGLLNKSIYRKEDRRAVKQRE